MNRAKTALFLTLLTLVFLWVGRIIGGPGGMTIAFVFALVLNFGSYWFSDRIVLTMYRAREVNQSDEPRLHYIVRNLSERANLPMPKIYIIPSETPNAFATGRGPKHAAVAVTKGILGLLDDDELEGVLSHELAHVRNRDILIGSIVATIAGAIFMIANMARWAAIFGGVGGRNSRSRGSGNLIGLIVMSIVAPIVAILIQMAISRAGEYHADRGGSEISGKPGSLANALRKLDRGVERLPMEVNPTTAHMFIVNPLVGGGLTKLFSTHPPIEDRIRRLEELKVSKIT